MLSVLMVRNISRSGLLKIFLVIEATNSNATLPSTAAAVVVAAADDDRVLWRMRLAKSLILIDHVVPVLRAASADSSLDDEEEEEEEEEENEVSDLRFRCEHSSM